ncbi:MAG: Isomerizing Glutamine-fructose-6-phosphate aminotransferase [Parcubacteria group bacterium GW2011_GWA2_47_10b]|nr:MAG: Isomerizing Glutamine-fructose-6-phosphate aminotransferase [Parcubacteria group bacterium GW2011_GWA2_47_10b]OGZ48027.1 MAG: glutamine--fructose-6-phosphate aminotransferase [Candidatus Ryanbacteria bacterium RIFCSPHIGHO2_02_FULL_47_25]
MCGIFGYIGKKDAALILLDGLATLEYRGYDSSGIYVSGAGNVKTIGAVENLRKIIPKNFYGTSGIAHLRWATHGEPTERNAHPHTDCAKSVWVVHNGIVENYKELGELLSLRGHKFQSSTDTEILAHLVEEEMKLTKEFPAAVSAALKKVRGTYGAAFMHGGEPNLIVAARMGAPVVIGCGTEENFVASDASPILRHTRHVVYLHDGDVAIVRQNSHHIQTLEGAAAGRASHTIEWDEAQVQKGGYDHFMLKEIMEAPGVVENAIRGRIVTSGGLAKFGGLEAVKDKLRDVKRIVIVGCGSAYYAGLVGEYMFEECAGISTEVEFGSEFRYRKPVVDDHTLLLAISQSGETADTLEAIREAKRKGALALGIVNTVGSTIARECDAGIYNHAGPEISVASTKAFVSQLTILALVTVFLGRQRNMSLATGREILAELTQIPVKIDKILQQKDKIRKLIARYSSFRDFLYIGRKYNLPIAYEGALKLKEVSYVHAEGYGAGEMKHGPLAMIDENFPTVAIVFQDSVYEKMISNIREIEARKGPVLALATEGDNDVSALVRDVLFIPKTLEILSPILAVVPLQLFAYFNAVEKGHNVDRPRNLAKSVTVE